VSRDVNSTTNGAWGEVLIGANPPQNGKDYGSGCAATLPDCAGGVGAGCGANSGTNVNATLLLKWDTASPSGCDNWSGGPTTACRRQCTTFVAPAGTVYLVLKSGQNTSGGVIADVSWDKVQICGVAGCALASECVDGQLCTQDVCSAVTGECENPPVECDEGETCDPETGNCEVGVAAPQLQSAASRRTHAGAGPFDLPMTLGSSATDIEPRVGTAGATPQSVLTFDSAIEATDGSADCGQEVVVSNGTCNSVSISGSTMTVNMTFGKNQCVAVALSGIRGAGGGSDLTGTSAVSVLTHEGNVNADDNVNLLDLNDIKLTLFQVVGAGNFKNDVNADASINLLDLNATKINLFVAKSTCP
jgi:hypothetical protein